MIVSTGEHGFSELASFLGLPVPTAAATGTTSSATNAGCGVKQTCAVPELRLSCTDETHSETMHDWDSPRIILSIRARIRTVCARAPVSFLRPPSPFLPPATSGASSVSVAASSAPLSQPASRS